MPQWLVDEGPARSTYYYEFAMREQTHTTAPHVHTHSHTLTRSHTHTSMYVCVHEIAMCVHVCMCAVMHVCVHAHAYVCLCILIRVCIRMHMCVPAYAYVRACTFICVCMQMHMCVRAHVRSCLSMCCATSPSRSEPFLNLPTRLTFTFKGNEILATCTDFFVCLLFVFSCSDLSFRVLVLSCSLGVISLNFDGST
jgi:hypothetical protein